MDRVLECAESTTWNLSTAAVVVLISFLLLPVVASEPWHLHPVLTVISAPPSGSAVKIMPPTHEQVFSWDRFQCDDYIEEVPDSEAEEELTANDLAYWDEACQKQAACSLFIGENKHTTAACALGGQGAEGRVGASASSEGASEATVAAGSDYDTVFTNAKAGMEDVDKTYVKNVVFEMSKDSNFFKNEQRKSEENSRRNLVLKQKLEALSAAELDAGEKWAAQHMLSLERSRDLSRTFIHVDMDMFFAAVEQMHRPELAHVPFAIGGLGMISTANYLARKYGVRSAMPGFIGKVLCSKPAPGSNLPPVELVFISPNFEKYTAVSQQVKEILKTFDAFIQSGGIDEAYLDVTDYMLTNNMSAVQVAEEIRARIRAAEYALPGSEAAVSGLTCSCGIAPNTRLAKICSDINKPDGQYVLAATREDILRFVSTLPIRKVGGIGKVSERMLHEVFSVSTCDDLRRMRAPIARLLHRCTAEFLLAVAIGTGSSDSHQQVESAGHGRKGISCERTFRSLFAKKDLEAKALELAEALAADMKEGKLQGKTLTLKLKPVTFDTFSRAVTLACYTDDSNTIFRAALDLLRKEYPLNIRLMGLRMSNLLQEGVSCTPLPPSQTTLGDFFGGGVGGASRSGGEGGALGKEPSGNGGERGGAMEKTKAHAELEEAVELLCELGYGRKEAENALRECGGNVERAANWLLARNGGSAQNVPVQSGRTKPLGSSGDVHRGGGGGAAGGASHRRGGRETAGGGGGGSIASFFCSRNQTGPSVVDTDRDATSVTSGSHNAPDGVSPNCFGGVVPPCKVEQIIEMGFSDRAAVSAALLASGGRVEGAISRLMGDSTNTFVSRRASGEGSVSKRMRGAEAGENTNLTTRKGAGPLDAVFMRKGPT